MRHDGGDAETGLGMEVGGGIAWVIHGSASRSISRVGRS